MNAIRPGDGDVRAYLETVEPVRRREDSFALLPLFERATGEKPVLWGGTMIGFGAYHYRYDSGREGDWFRAGFAPRKANIAVHIMPNLQKHQDVLPRLGKHKSAVSCVYINKLADVDMAVLEELVAASYRDIADIYGP